jgi:hypothetical protein
VDVRCGFDETYGIRAVSNTGLGWEYDVDLGTFDANGWTYTATDGPRTDTDTYWLALNFDGAIDTKVITLDTPTSTGEDTESGIGFKPQALVVGMTFIESVGVVNGTTGGPIGIGFIDEDEMYSQSIASENAIGTSNTQSLSDDILNITTETGGTGVQATMPSGDVFVSNGFVLDFTQVEAAAKKWWVVAFEEESAGTPASDSQSAYVAGQDATTDSQAAYVSGQDVASDSQSAYMVGASAGGTSTDSQPAYAEGLTYMPFTEPWTGDNEDEWRRSHWEIDAG